MRKEGLTAPLFLYVFVLLCRLLNGILHYQSCQHTVSSKKLCLHLKKWTFVLCFPHNFLSLQ